MLTPGRGPLANPSVEAVARALTLTVDEVWRRGYMQEWRGFNCVDAGDIGGRAAMPLADHIEVETGWRSAWPLPEPLFDVLEDVRIPDDHWTEMVQSTEDEAFDLIEDFHGHVSEGIEDHERSSLHTWQGCGLALRGLRSSTGSSAVRQRMSRTLTKY